MSLSYDFNLEEIKPRPKLTDVTGHPLELLAELAKDQSLRIKSFKLFKYHFTDDDYQSPLENREGHIIPAEEIVEKGMALINRAAKQDMDVVLDSRVEVESGGFTVVKHLPFMDLDIPKVLPFGMGPDTVMSSRDTELWNMLGFGSGDLRIYATGRSYHAYTNAEACCLLNGDDWRNYMASLLLLPPLEDMQPVVDTRWVGHCLIRGSGALRLSCQDQHYLQYPTEVL